MKQSIEKSMNLELAQKNSRLCLNYKQKGALDCACKIKGKPIGMKSYTAYCVKLTSHFSFRTK